MMIIFVQTSYNIEVFRLPRLQQLARDTRADQRLADSEAPIIIIFVSSSSFLYNLQENWG
jgi:hypothetical protein